MDEKKKFRFYGRVLYYIVKLLDKTLRVKEIIPETLDREETMIYGFWHNKVLISIFGSKWVKKRAGLASPTKDGELIAVPLELENVYVVRGSSNKESVRSLLELIKKVKEGYSVGTPVDGPKGPVYEVKSGMIYLAQKSGKKMVPLGGAYSNSWTFNKTWDKFQLPKPFSKVVLVYGEPYEIPKDADMDFECAKLKRLINEVNLKAEEELKKFK